MRRRPLAIALNALLAGSLLAGCSVRRLAVNKVADGLTGGSSTFATDNDPELVRDALPFSLKLMESLLAETPRHIGLLTTLGMVSTQYAYAFVEQEAERTEEDDLDRARELEERARNLYLRGLGYCLRGLEVRHPGFTNALAIDPRSAAAETALADVPLLYWAATSWAAAIAQSKDDPALVGDLPKVEALLFRALDLDEAWNHGAIHSLLIPLEMSRTTAEGDPVARATRHFERARSLGAGRLAGPFVAYAEAVCVPQEDREQFVRLLHEALRVDVDAEPASRLENLIHQRRAKWLLGRVDKLILPPVQ